MILLIDNYDSFTYNLYQYLGELGKEITVVRNDKITIGEIEKLSPEAIILSPGPGRPENAGICIDVIMHFYKYIPMLGICLGHQAIGAAFQGIVKKAKEIKHGKISKLHHTGSDLFQDMPQLLDIMRYHSLVIEQGTLSDDFQVLGTSSDDGEMMAIKHKNYPLYGLQFHPESVGTITGKQILTNFLNILGREKHENNSAAII